MTWAVAPGDSKTDQSCSIVTGIAQPRTGSSKLEFPILTTFPGNWKNTCKQSVGNLEVFHKPRRGDSGQFMQYLRTKPPILALLFIVLNHLPALTPLYGADARLTWSANPENNIAGYRVYYGTASRVYPNSADAGSQTTYTVTGLGPGTYYFAVTAYNTSAQESAFSSEVSKVIDATGDSTSPSVPTNLTAVPMSASQINLSWTPSTDNIAVTGYRIYRNGSQVSSATTNAYSDVGLPASTTYTYTVSAYDEAGNASAQSTAATATTSGGSPSPTPGTISINFQPAAAAAPPGFSVDDGSLFSSTRGYGWSFALPSRQRGVNPDPKLDTLVFSQSVATWNYTIANGSYLVSLAAGDPSYDQGPQRVLIEGQTAINNISTAAGSFQTVTDLPVTVTDGQMTVVIGGTSGYTTPNYVIIRPSGAPPPGRLPAPTNVRVR